jgi:hypothetical protein
LGIGWFALDGGEGWGGETLDDGVRGRKRVGCHVDFEGLVCSCWFLIALERCFCWFLSLWSVLVLITSEDVLEDALHRVELLTLS